MDAYFCPRCNEDLNLQNGFGPEQLDWVCDNCGANLHHDQVEDPYIIPGETKNLISAEEIKFDWKCSHCGGKFDPPKKSRLEKKKKGISGEYFCPVCDAYLNMQAGFHSSASLWICKSCGQRLKGEEVYFSDKYSGKEHNCKKCGSLMNIQPGFSEMYDQWKCSSCNEINPLVEGYAATIRYNADGTTEIFNPYENGDAPKPNEKDKNTALLLCLFGGCWGLHKFYEGKTMLGLIYLLTNGLFFVGAVIDFFKILMMPNKKYNPNRKKEGNPIFIGVMLFIAATLITALIPGMRSLGMIFMASAVVTLVDAILKKRWKLPKRECKKPVSVPWMVLTYIYMWANSLLMSLKSHIIPYFMFLTLYAILSVAMLKRARDKKKRS